MLTEPMKRVATIAFIAVIALIGLALGMRRTVADGRVVAAELLAANQPTNQRLARIECEPAIPIGVAGASFLCTHIDRDGTAVSYRYTMDRTGSMRGEPIRTTAGRHP